MCVEVSTSFKNWNGRVYVKCALRGPIRGVAKNWSLLHGVIIMPWGYVVGKHIPPPTSLKYFLQTQTKPALHSLKFSHEFSEYTSCMTFSGNLQLLL